MLKQSLRFTIGTGLFVFFSITSAKLPDNEFACHVATESGIDGIVLIQSKTIDDASAVALTSKALTIDKKESSSTQVIECKEKYSGRFSSREIQQLYDSMPM